MKKPMLLILVAISFFASNSFAKEQSALDLAKFVATNIIYDTSVELWNVADCERSNDLFEQIDCIAQNTLVTVDGLELETNDAIPSQAKEVWLEYFDPEQNCDLSIKFDLGTSRVVWINKWSCAGIPLETDHN